MTPFLFYLSLLYVNQHPPIRGLVGATHVPHIVSYTYIGICKVIHHFNLLFKYLVTNEDIFLQK